MRSDSITRRDVFKKGGMTAAGLAGASLVEGAATNMPSPDVYTRIGVKPFINCTATLTINGGSQTFPEVIAAIEQASHFHVNLNELMEKVSARLAELLWASRTFLWVGHLPGLRHAAAITA